MLDQIYEQYAPFASSITAIYRYLREEREEYRVSGRIEADCLSIDDLMEACSMDSFGEALSKIEHIQRLMNQLREAGYLPEDAYNEAEGKTSAFKAYVSDQYSRMKAKREEPISQDVYDQAVQMAKEMGQISVAMIQRRLHTGYATGVRIVDLLEKNGVVGPAIGAKPRKTL